MILPGKIAVQRGIINGLRDLKIQNQPCGVDLTVRYIHNWTSAGVVDFDNSRRSNSINEKLSFINAGPDDASPSLQLLQGAYLIEFNETVDIPLDIMAQIYVRSSMFRSGASVTAGVMDSGYKGAIGAMLQVLNPSGLVLYENAKVAQMVFHEMSEETEGYSGVYQGDLSIGVQSGREKGKEDS